VPVFLPFVIFLVALALLVGLMLLASPGARLSDLTVRRGPVARWGPWELVAAANSDRGAIGTGSTLVRFLPDIPYELNPVSFAERTRKNYNTRGSVPYAAGTQLDPIPVPNTGVLAAVRIFFDGQVVVSQDPDAGITWRDWPYGILDRVTLRVSGSNELWSAPGIALHAKRFVQNPAYEDATDVFPGVVGGSATTVADGTYSLKLMYEMVLPVDMTTLGAALFLQSSTINADLRLDTAAAQAGITVTGAFRYEFIHFEVPFNDTGAVIIPDVSRRQGFNHTSKQFDSTGEVPVDLIRTPGQLHRIFFWVDTTAGRLSMHQSAATSSRIDNVRLEYAGNQVPRSYEPAVFLLTENNNHYGAPLPYKMGCIDLVRENPLRDVIEMMGVTDLRLVLDINSAVTAAGGRVHVVQQTLG
jgi:hypothetical protein